MGLLERLREHHVNWKHADPKARRAAVRQLGDPALLDEIARSDPEASVREEAADALLRLAVEGQDEGIGLAALAALSDLKHLVAVARSAVLEPVARAALPRLADARALGSVARHGRHAAIRLEALGRIADPAELGAVALKSIHEDAALAAIERLADEEVLEAVAGRARSRAAARRARAMLRARLEAAAGAAPALRLSDRRKQIQLCEKVEALARSVECEPLEARIAAAREAWDDLIPDIDEDLAERFTADCLAARERLARNRAEREERERRKRERAEYVARHIAPRAALCEAVESARGEGAPRTVDDARWEWERLAPLDTDEGRDLALRFERACVECLARHGEWDKEQAEARLEAERQAGREERARQSQERARRQRENAGRLRLLCERAAGLLRAGTLTLKTADPVLREVRAAVDEMPELPSRRERAALLKRLKAIQAALAPKVKDLRDSDAWKRWANEGVQEELCALAEALREVTDPLEAARQAQDLQERWMKASAASKDRAQELWLRFKAAQDEVRARVEAHHAEQAARKQGLCEQAEALVDSTDLGRAAEAVQGLQIEWKKIGAATRGQEKALWERFKSACDRFFARRKEALARRKDEWAKNLEAKEALCARAEKLADSTDWEAAASEVKRLQADWRKIGPVRKNRSEALWQRFRGACDRFFERYKRRHQINLEANLAVRDGLCRELEALLAAVAATGPEGAAQDPPAGDGPGPAPAPGRLLETLQSAWSRWQQCAPLPPEHAAPLLERFDGALGRLIAAHPDPVKGSDFDVDQNHRRMEELCVRVERLMPAGAAPAEASLSPAARLATLWREALATNTMGGRVADEAKWRAASEDLKKAQAAWQRLGYVSEAVRRTLSERFERACHRFAAARDRALGPQEPGGPRGGRPPGRARRPRPSDRPRGGGPAPDRDRDRRR
ncbi:MAG: DUF349 domain-containing protein [Acidobacteria bacterium]|nr:DUF349 domain-containing protein [Acidobacteriota bacterium]